MITLTLLILALTIVVVGIVLFVVGMPIAALVALDLLLPIGVFLGLGKLIFGKKKK